MIEQQLATQRESERSDLSLRLVESGLEASLQEAAKARASTLAVREELESFEQDLAEIDSASVDISLFAADRTKEGNFLASATCGRSKAGRERLLGFPRGGSEDVAVTQMVDASTTRCGLGEPEAQHREIELDCLLDVGENRNRSWRKS